MFFCEEFFNEKYTIQTVILIKTMKDISVKGLTWLFFHILFFFFYFHILFFFYLRIFHIRKSPQSECIFICNKIIF